MIEVNEAGRWQNRYRPAFLFFYSDARGMSRVRSRIGDHVIAIAFIGVAHRRAILSGLDSGITKPEELHRFPMTPCSRNTSLRLSRALFTAAG
jgi:hypothetical protein